jgi:hypothetical protein
MRFAERDRPDIRLPNLQCASIKEVVKNSFTALLLFRRFLKIILTKNLAFVLTKQHLNTEIYNKEKLEDAFS